MSVPPKVTADIAQAGGRHYRGRGLGALTAWKCVACGAENAGSFAAGCNSCGAGAPGTQVRKSGEAAAATAAAAPKVVRKLEPAVAASGHAAANAGSPAPRRLGDQLRARAGMAPVDYDEIERRMVRALELRLGGGYSAQERATIFLALECYIALWETDQINPDQGLALEATRALALKVAPDEGLEFTEPEDSNADTTTATTNAQQAGSSNSNIGNSADPDAGSSSASDLGGYAPDFDAGDEGDDDPDAAERRANTVDGTHEP